MTSLSDSMLPARGRHWKRLPCWWGVGIKSITNRSSEHCGDGKRSDQRQSDTVLRFRMHALLFGHAPIFLLPVVFNLMWASSKVLNSRLPLMSTCQPHFTRQCNDDDVTLPALRGTAMPAPRTQTSADSAEDWLRVREASSAASDSWGVTPIRRSCCADNSLPVASLVAPFAVSNAGRYSMRRSPPSLPSRKFEH
jgi:hypothetical protein